MVASLQDPYLPVFTPFYSPLLHCIRVCLWPVEFGKTDGMSFPKLEKTLLFPSQLLFFPWIIRSGGSKLLCCEQPYGEAHVVNNWNLASHHVSEVESSSFSPVKLCYDCSPSFHLHYTFGRNAEPQPPT